MKSQIRFLVIIPVLCFIVFTAEVAVAMPMGTVFTYQGRLIDTNSAADGLYDFQFKLYDAPDDGIQLDGDVNKPDVDVIDGYFTVELDFGSDVFDGNSVWLEIGVRPGDVNDAYTVLYPRQEVTPTPYALQTRGIFVGSSGTVGVGTKTPDRNLDIRHSNTGGGIEIDRSSSTIWSGLVYENDGEEKWFVGVKPDSNNLLFKSDTAGISILIENETGNVGIGVETPDASLSVQGGNWDLSSTEGDLKIGNADYRLKIGTATGGAGAGDVRIRAHGGTNRLLLGHDVSDVLTLSNRRVGLGTIEPDRNLDIRHSNSGGGIEIDRSADTIWSGIVYEDNGSENWFIGVQADSDNLLFRDDGVRNSLVIQDGTGRVGIGTAEPTEKLEVDGHVIAGPVVGKWRCDSTDTSWGMYQWDTQLINTNSNYLSWSSGTDEITILRAGYYSVSAMLTVSNLDAGDVTYAQIYHNIDIIARSYRFAGGSLETHQLNVIEYFDKNDVVKCYVFGGDRFGSSIPYTVLSIHRLN